MFHLCERASRELGKINHLYTYARAFSHRNTGVRKEES